MTAAVRVSMDVSDLAVIIAVAVLVGLVIGVLVGWRR
jgi:hypothetical protein